MRSTPNILLIEDSLDDQELIREYMTETPYGSKSLTICSSLQEGLKCLEDHKPDVLLLDLSLPDSTGLNGLYEIREANKDVVIIIMTGFNDDETALQALEAGAQDYLVKGRFDDYGLFKAIDYSIQRFQTLRKIESQAEELRQFAYLCAHNLKSPLVNVQGLLTLISETDDQEVINEMLRRSQESVERMKQMINMVNEVIETKEKVKKEPLVEVALKPVVNAVLDDLHDLITKSNVSVQVNIDDVESVVFPETQLRSILQNLISNGINYARPDTESEVLIEASMEEHSAQLKVTDNGRGIDLTKYGHKLFELFQRFHLDVEGKGIGLYLVRYALDQHNGSISVDSQVGVGTTFTVQLGNTA